MGSLATEAGSAGTEAGPAKERLSGTRLLSSWVLALSCAMVLASALQIRSGQREQGYFVFSLCLVVCFAAAWSDVATRRIPNVLTYPAILLGLALNGVLPLVLEAAGARSALVLLGSSGSFDCFQGFGACAGIGIVSFMARGLGGGDVKILAAVGALLGLSQVMGVLFNTLLIAAVLGIANWALRGGLMKRLQGFVGAIYFSIVLKGDMRSVYRFGASEGPFALSLLLGLISYQFVSLYQVLMSFGW